MANYTQISETETQAILNLYGIQNIQKISPLSLGISNSNYRVDLKNQKSILLKISDDKNPEQLADEQKILMYLSEKKYPFSLKPFLTSNGESVYHFEKYFGVLFPFVEGIPPGPSDFTCKEVGHALAKLHSISHDSNELKNLRSHEKVGFGANEIYEYVQSKNCPIDFKEAFYNLFNDHLKEFRNTPFHKGIIHGDLYYDNTLFDQNKLSHVLDFEQAGIGEYILDLGISISGTCLEKGRIINPLVKSYLEGYEEVRPLNKIESRFIHQAVLIGLFSISLWRIKRFKEGNLNPQMENSYRDLLLKAYEYEKMQN